MLKPKTYFGNTLKGRYITTLQKGDFPPIIDYIAKVKGTGEVFDTALHFKMNLQLDPWATQNWRLESTPKPFLGVTGLFLAAFRRVHLQGVE